MRAHLAFGPLGALGVVAIVAACGGGSAASTSPATNPPQDRGLETEAPDASAEANAQPAVDNITGTCQYSCDTKADCCTDCTYPLNSECVNHRCVWQGCSGDADCKREQPSGLPFGDGVVCRAVEGVNRCVRACAKLDDCTNGQACFAKDDQGQLYCSFQVGGTNPCGSGPECWACKSDGDCDGKHGVGFGVCSAVTHTCGCAVDAQCPTHNVCDHSGK